MPDLSYELQYAGRTAGVDEAGRGPWAGPVVAAAVMFNPTDDIPSGLDDSKKLSSTKREALYVAIIAHHHVGVGISDVKTIDQINILQATKQAMSGAVAQLSCVPHQVLVDGNQRFEASCPVIPLVKGDSLSLSIAAASIVAKVTRDRLMCQLHQEYPHYGWDSNKGYGTAQHQEGLAAHGVTSHHRRSFAPIRAILEQQAA